MFFFYILRIAKTLGLEMQAVNQPVKTQDEELLAVKLGYTNGKSER